jgi:hypothetical protein
MSTALQDAIKWVNQELAITNPDDYCVKFTLKEPGRSPEDDVVWRPFPKQAVFVKQNGMLGLFGGAAGPGKSSALRNMAVSFCLKRKNYRVIYFRKTIEDVVESAVDKLKIEYEKYWNTGLMYYNEKARILTFPETNANIKFEHLKDMKAAHSQKSKEYELIIFDELTEFGEEEFFYMFTRNRSSTPRFKPLIRAGSNPDGPGADWVKRFFVDRDFTRRERKAFEVMGLDIDKEVFFIPARLEDNPVNDTPEYRARLMLQDERTEAALLRGEWENQDGRYFSEFNPEVHIIEPFEIDSENEEEYVVVTGTDDGFDPSAHATLWVAKDRNGIAYVIKEFYAKKCYTDQQIVEIKERNRGLQIKAHIADSEMWTKDKKDITSASVFERYLTAGLRLEKATKSREMGWRLIKDCLRYEKRGDRFVVSPKLYIFNTCPNLVEHIKRARKDEPPRENDVKKIMGHDTLDALRYAMMYLMQQNVNTDSRKRLLGSSIADSILKNFGNRYSNV